MSSASPDLITLETEDLRLLVDPACGGKLRSLVSKRSGQEFFYQDARTDFDPARGYSYHDLGGGDECFPTVGPCRGQTPDGIPYDYADHGFLWQGPWQVLPGGAGLNMTCALPAVNCTFTRRCSFDAENQLRLDYHIVNYGAEPVPYVYSFHPLLEASDHTRVVLPPGLTRAFNYMSSEHLGLPLRKWFDAAAVDPALLTGPLSLRRKSYIKLFSGALERGWAAVEHPDSGERLVFTFDTRVLKYTGCLVSQGHDSLQDGHFAQKYLLAFEPTTGIGDEVETCLQTGTLNTLAPGAALNFWICLSVERM